MQIMHIHPGSSNGVLAPLLNPSQIVHEVLVRDIGRYVVVGGCDVASSRQEIGKLFGDFFVYGLGSPPQGPEADIPH